MTMRMVARAVLLLALSVGSVAQAGGFEIPENTTRALGRAGANIAHVSDPTAIYLNPAGMVKSDGFALSGSLNLPMAFHRFQRAPHEYTGMNANPGDAPHRITFREERNSLSFMPAPMLFMSHDFGLENTTFGFAAYGPSSMPSLRWNDNTSGWNTPSTLSPEDGPREGGNVYMLQDADLLVVYPSIAVAHRFENIGLSIGGAFQLVYAHTRVALGLEGTTGVLSLNDAYVRSPEHPGGTQFDETAGSVVGAEVKTGGFGVTGNFGITYDPIPQLSIGLSYRPAHKVKMKGTVAIAPSPELEPLELELLNNRATMDIVMPHVLRFGINYRHIVDDFEVFDIELAATYEMWSIVKQMVANTPGPISSTGFDARPIGEVALPFNFNNTLSLRLGGDFNGLRDRTTGVGLALRGGVFWESNGSPLPNTNILFMPFQRVGLSAGFSYYFPKVSLDFAAMWLRNFSRTVENGEFDIINPLWVCHNGQSVPGATPDEVLAACDTNGDNSPYHAVNNGTYKSDIVNLSVGLTYNW